MSRHSLPRPSKPVMSHWDLGAYIEAELYDVLHGDQAPDDKVAQMHALAAFARSVSTHWALVSKFYGQSAERVWFAMCGLDREGMPTAEMVNRVSDVASETTIGGGDDA